MKNLVWDRMSRRYLIEFSGEHPSLPMEELKGAAEGCGEVIEGIEGEGRLRAVKSENILCAVKRCALLHLIALECALPIFQPGSPQGAILSASELYEKGREIERFIDLNFPHARRYRLTLRKVGGRFSWVNQDAIIHGIARGIRHEVALREPEVEIVIFIMPHLYFGIPIYENRRAEYGRRAVKNRPFFSPISLHPGLARTLVNLCRVKKGEILVDPFCGTGGILIEASLMGITAIGADRSIEMLKGAELNLKHAGAEALLIHSDVGELPENLKKNGIMKVDAIATDLPYGRASTTFGENISHLYARAFEVFKAVLKPGGYAAVVSPSPAQSVEGMRIITTHSLRVHRSLTRYFTVYKNTPNTYAGKSHS